MARCAPPTAGNTGGTAWVALVGPEQTDPYWRATTDEAWRSRNIERAEGLRRAPVVLLAYASPGAYIARYGEADKADPELASDPARWPVPYWYGDAAFGVMIVLLGAVEAGLGACFIGAFRGETQLSGALGVPEGWTLFGAVVLGRPDGRDRRSRSLARPGPRESERIHWGRWTSQIS